MDFLDQQGSKGLKEHKDFQDLKVPQEELVSLVLPDLKDSKDLKEESDLMASPVPKELLEREESLELLDLPVRSVPPDHKDLVVSQDPKDPKEKSE